MELLRWGWICKIDDCLNVSKLTLEDMNKLSQHFLNLSSAGARIYQDNEGQSVEISFNPLALELGYSMITRSIPWLLMSWRHLSPGGDICRQDISSHGIVYARSIGEHAAHHACIIQLFIWGNGPCSEVNRPMGQTHWSEPLVWHGNGWSIEQ